MQITISPKKVGQVLTLVIGGLILASIASQFSKHILGDAWYARGLVRLFDVNREQNVPAWYGSSTLLLCSGLLTVIAVAKKRESDPYAVHWRVMSLVFLFLSLDEAAGIHEMATRRFPTGHYPSGFNFLYYAWVVPGAAVVAIFVLSYLRFLVNLPAKTRSLFILAGTVFVGGALGVESVGWWYDIGIGGDRLVVQMIGTVEELAEKSGVLIFMYALLSYISSYLREVKCYINEE